MKATTLLGACVANLAVMVALDLLWTVVLAEPIDQRGIGHLMADEPRVAVAALFCALFALGPVVFAVHPTAWRLAGTGRLA